MKELQKPLGKIINNQLLDTITEKAKESPRLRMNHNLHNSLEDRVQQLLNALEPGTEIPIHRHTHTSETYLLLRGKIKVFFHNDQGEVVESFNLIAVGTNYGENHQKKHPENYGLNIPAGQWHSLEVLESGTIILEIKEGPYKPLGPEEIISKVSHLANSHK